MKKFMVIMIIMLMPAFGHLMTVREALALDPPHNNAVPTGAYPITCSRCHYPVTGELPLWATLPTGTDNTFRNNLCTDCHTAGRLSTSRYSDIATHSSIQTSDRYGNWSIECIICHSPHAQPQNSFFANDPALGIVTGTVLSIVSTPSATQSVITVGSTGLPVNGYVGCTIVPNTAYGFKMYRILSNTENSFTVAGAVNQNYAAPASPSG